MTQPIPLPSSRSGNPCQAFDLDEVLFCESLVAKDPTAIECLIERMKKFFYHRAVNTGELPEDDAKDVLFGSLAFFIENINDGTYACQGVKVMSYVGNIVQNLLRSHWRRGKRWTTFDDFEKKIFGREDSEDEIKTTPTGELAGDDGPSDDDICAQRAARQAFDALTPAQQNVIHAYWVEGMTLKEFEVRFGYAEGGGRLLHHRTRPRLRELFHQFFNDCTNGRAI